MCGHEISAAVEISLIMDCLRQLVFRSRLKGTLAKCIHCKITINRVLLWDMEDLAVYIIGADKKVKIF